jgi:ATP-dependent DNA helicase RecG
MKQKNKAKAVHRIVIGDVGSGKTIVAFFTALTFLHGVESGEVAMLAPTEVLAYQHYLSLLELTQNISNNTKYEVPEIIFLSSKNREINGEKYTKSKLEKAVENIQNQNKKIFWIGTHSLLHSDQISPDMVLIDEQHRFGVQQRKKLTREQENQEAHFISFTATPIPRTLALTFFDSLQPLFLSKLTDRKPIQTIQKSQENFLEIAKPYIENRIQKCEKIYVINAKVVDKEDDDNDEVWSIKKTSELLEKQFPGKVLSVHGKEKEKKAILNEFKTSPDKHILVATTVVEVGVDVGQATLMLILNSERYGLSALHQIRGRIGRNDLDDNLCVLFTPEKYQYIKRLRFLKETNDGFVLAEKDLELRGSGDVIGSIQSGFDYDIDELLGLPPEQYEAIKSLAKDAIHRDDLPRLEQYLNKELTKIWEE